MFCLNYYPNQKYLQDVDELKIKYRSSDKTLKDFLDKFKDTSIVIEITDNFDQTDAKLLAALEEEYGNFRLIIDFNNKEILQLVKDYQIPFFFSNFVTTMDELHGLLKYKPTDMYICEDLGFHLDKVSKILRDNFVKVRVFPNICQSSFPETPSLKTFFIRPEDIPVYALFVDVFELITDEDRQQVIYRVYKQNRWFGKIRELIPTFKNDLDTKYLLDSFGIIRVKCGKRCTFKPESCSICERYEEVAETLKDNDIIIRSVKEKD